MGLDIIILHYVRARTHLAFMLEAEDVEPCELPMRLMGIADYYAECFLLEDALTACLPVS